MKVIVVDDEQIALKDMEESLRELPDITEVTTFLAPQKALEWAGCNPVDIAFLDIRMRRMDGLRLAKCLKEIRPMCAVVFVSGYSEYAIHAFHMHASGYLMKPATAEAILREVEHILHPPALTARNKKAVQIRCFGNFEVFIQGSLVKFRYSKTKELLAYLVDRHGAAVKMGELCAVLWEDKPDSVSLRSQLRNSVSDLTGCMKKAGVLDLLRKQKNCIAMNVNAVDCDYFSFLQMEADAVNAYRGEYMTQYSWAEMTLGSLEGMRDKDF